MFEYPKCYIHVGLPKTGTTTLQLGGVYEQFKNLNIVHKYIGGDRLELPKLIDEFSKCGEEDSDKKTYIAMRFKKYILTNSKNHSEKKPILLSSEGLIGAVIQRKISIEQLSNFLNFFFRNIVIIIGIREQGKWLKSCYTNWYGRSILYGQKHYQRWIKNTLEDRNYRVNRVFIDYNELVYQISKIVAPEEIIILVFEEIFNKSQYVPEIVSKTIGLEVKEKHNKIDIKNAKPSSSKLVTDNYIVDYYIKIRNKLFPKLALSNAFGFSITSFLKKVQSAINLDIKHKIIVNDDSIMKLIDEASFRIGNRKLDESRNLGLKKYGYYDDHNI